MLLCMFISFYVSVGDSTYQGIVGTRVPVQMLGLPLMNYGMFDEMQAFRVLH